MRNSYDGTVTTIGGTFAPLITELIISFDETNISTQVDILLIHANKT